jgi:hypothetical protein
VSLVEAARLFQVALEFERWARLELCDVEAVVDAQESLVHHEFGFTGEWLERLGAG